MRELHTAPILYSIFNTLYPNEKISRWLLYSLCQIFVVFRTSAPIASIVPISSWIGFEVGLIQTELNKIKALYPDSTIGNTSAFAVFLKTIEYRYYCIFMLIFIPFLIISGVSDYAFHYFRPHP
jgi:hypothetical protein